jgi:hypothetical protein
MLPAYAPKGNEIMASDHLFAREVAERQRTMFALFVGPGLFVTRAALSAASRIPASTLKEWASGTAIPFHDVMALSRFLPAEAINLLCEPAGKRLVDDHADDGASWDGIAANAAGLTAEICEARRDGKISPSEDASLKRRVRTLIAEASAMTTGGGE